MVRIGFAAPLARPILDPQFRCDFGGAEVRAVNFALGLSRDHSWDVSMVLRSYHRESPRRLGRVTAYFERAAAPLPRTRDLRRDHTFVWKWASIKCQKIWRTLSKSRADERRIRPKVLPMYRDLPADVLCVFGVHHYAANVIRSGQASNKQTVLFLASETDLDERYLRDAINAYRQRSDMCRFALANADWVIAQTEPQQRLLQERFGLASTVIRSPIDLHTVDRPPPRAVQGDYILWIGRADTFSKRADKFFQLAASLPHVPFVGIVNKRNEKTFTQLMSQVPKNIQVVEHVPYQQIEHYVAHASALLNTSDAEGFPNTFLQAGKFGVPVLSLTVDPESMLSAAGCGLVGHGDIKQMAELVQHFWSARATEFARQLSKNLNDYVRRRHAIDERLTELKNVLHQSPRQRAA